MPNVQDEIVIKIKNGEKTAAVPCIAIMADKFVDSLPSASISFGQIISDLQESTKAHFSAKDPAIKLPSRESFSNCNGRWAEYIYAAYAWNALVARNRNPNSEFCYVYVKIPNNSNVDSEWISMLDDANKAALVSFSRDKHDPQVMRAGHNAFLLCSSNPDAVILKFPKDQCRQLLIPLDILHPIDNLSLDTIKKIDTVFQALCGKVCPYDNLQCFLSIKNSMRPDRRYQFVHEGNNIKAVLLYLIARRVDARLTRDAVQKKYYAVSLSGVSNQDKKTMETAMTACLMDLTAEPIWAVDKVFDCTYPINISDQFNEILN